MKPQIFIKWCGTNLSYSNGLRLQKHFLDSHLRKLNGDSLEPGRNTLLLLEHSPVYTLGVRTKGYTTEDAERLRKLGADFITTDRGGLITFHGPGQLVAYPILNLTDFFPGCGFAKGVKWYVCQLEKCLISLCKEFGLTAAAPGPPLTGVWVDGRKVAAIGIHATKHSLVNHGLAFNYNCDLGWFDHIVPCGLDGKRVTSLAQELSRDGRQKNVEMLISLENVKQVFIECFAQQFDCIPVMEPEMRMKV